MTKKKLDDRFTREMIETAEGMRASGIMSDAAYEKITTRLLGRAATAAAKTTAADS